MQPQGNAVILQTSPLASNEDLKLMTLVGDFLAAFDGLQMLITTPFPFPLVQITWIFSRMLANCVCFGRTARTIYLAHKLLFCHTSSVLGVLPIVGVCQPQ
jgi:hypothetical protein